MIDTFYCPLLDAECMSQFGSIFCKSCDVYRNTFVEVM